MYKEPAEETQSAIETMTKRLYAKNGQSAIADHRTRLHQTQTTVPEDWNTEGKKTDTQPDVVMPRSLEKHKTKIRLFVLLTAIGCVIALVALFFVFTSDSNSISLNRVAITVRGPISIPAGDTLTLDIDVENKNTSALETVDLIVEYPQGTRSTEDASKELTTYRVGLGSIDSGDRVSKTVHAVLFGEEGNTETITLRVEYRLAGSNAIFSKERAFVVDIISAPITVTVDAPTNINTGDMVAINITLVSNSQTVLKDVRVKPQYPFGFIPKELTPLNDSEAPVWKIGDIEPGGKRTLTLTGTIEGQQDEQRVFRFDVGLGTTATEDITSLFLTKQYIVTIARPFVTLALSFGNEGETKTPVAQPGGMLTTSIIWKNNLPVTLTDVVLTVTLDGETLNKSRVNTSGGFYDSRTNTIRWDRRTLPELALVEAGQTGRVGLDLAFLPLQSIDTPSANHDVVLTTQLTGVPTSDDSSSRSISTTEVRTIRIESTVAFIAQVFRSIGLFENSGPIPPQAEKKTTYTVQWSVSNTFNTMNNVIARGVLPPSVSWEGITAPSNENITYNPTSGEVVWTIGTLVAGAGYTTPTRDVSFQVGLTPSVSQVGTEPILLDQMEITGTDTFTNSLLKQTIRLVTTRTSVDPEYRNGDGTVVALP